MSQPTAQTEETKDRIIRNGEWLTIRSYSYSARSTGIVRELEIWETAGQIFSIPHKGERYYARFQFDEYGTPLPVIKEVLDLLKTVMDSWSIAAWFAFPNSWTANEVDGAFIAVRPSAILDRREVLLNAAAMVRASYVA